jgi:hypothetical protein
MHTIVYSTSSSPHTVTIDYNQARRLFHSEREHYPFSAECMLRMLNAWARLHRVQQTVVGRLHIAVGEVTCILTQQATIALCHCYRSRREWQIEFPFLNDVFAPSGDR